MTIQLLTVDLSRGLSRVRLFFSGALASGAFTSTSYYGVTNSDGLGSPTITVVAVFAVSGNSAAVELAIEPPFTPGAQYTFSVTSLPAADLSTLTASIGGSIGAETQNLPDVEPAAGDLDLLLYDRDIVHDGTDFVETATGDLDDISGRPNWLGAITRRMTSSGIRWDPSYSPRSDEYVNAPDLYRQPLAGSLVAQARADDRTKKATVAIAQDPQDSSGNGWIFQMTIVGRDSLDPQTVNLSPSDVGVG